MNIHPGIREPIRTVITGGAGAAIFTAAAAIAGTVALPVAAVFGAALAGQGYVISKIANAIFEDKSSLGCSVFKLIGFAASIATSTVFTFGAFALAGTAIAIPPLLILTGILLGAATALVIVAIIIAKCIGWEPQASAPAYT